MTDTASPKGRIGLSEMDGGKYLTFGSLYILLIDSFLFPLDTLKTLVMSAKGRQNQQGLFELGLRITQNEGLFRLWRGLGPSVLGSFPGQAAYYLAYESAQDALKSIKPPSSSDYDPHTFLKGFVAGACAEVAGGLFYVPADVVSQRLQVQSLSGFTHNKRLFKGPIDVARCVYKAEGVSGFFRGYTGYLATYAPASAIQWGTYEFSKIMLHNARKSLFPKTVPPEGSATRQSHTLTLHETLINSISGGAGAACAVLASNPLEVVRVRYQLLEMIDKNDALSIRQGYFRLGLRIWQEEGLRAFYRGLKLRLVTTVPSAMCAMSGYETIKSWSFDSK